MQTSNPNFISINGQDKELILNSSDGQIVISNLDMPAIPFCFQDLASIELMSSGQCTGMDHIDSFSILSYFNSLTLPL